MVRLRQFQSSEQLERSESRTDLYHLLGRVSTSHAPWSLRTLYLLLGLLIRHCTGWTLMSPQRSPSGPLAHYSSLGTVKISRNLRADGGDHRGQTVYSLPEWFENVGRDPVTEREHRPQRLLDVAKRESLSAPAARHLVCLRFLFANALHLSFQLTLHSLIPPFFRRIVLTDFLPSFKDTRRAPLGPKCAALPGLDVPVISPRVT
jgi:hypothetical protein